LSNRLRQIKVGLAAPGRAAALRPYPTWTCWRDANLLQRLILRDPTRRPRRPPGTSCCFVRASTTSRGRIRNRWRFERRGGTRPSGCR